jgi:DNA polymerase-3 subunit delta'
MRLLNNIIAQSHAINILKKATENMVLPTAYLFFGPDGVGKSTTARIIAKILNCKHNGCNRCNICYQIDKRSYLGVREINVLPDKHQISIGQIRELQRDVFLTIPEVNCKVYILKDIEKMSKEASNAFLKTLEEPPDKVLFILTTNAIDTLLPTIISRCQLVRFNPVPVEEIKKLLITKGISKDKASYLAEISGGSIGKAIEYTKDEVVEIEKIIDQYIDRIFQYKDVTRLFEFMEKIGRYNKDRIDIVLDIISWRIRKYFPHTILREAIKIIVDTRYQIIIKNVNIQLGLEMMFLKLLYIK